MIKKESAVVLQNKSTLGILVLLYFIAGITGIAIWASVSDEVNARIREQILARIFPIRLKADDWASGDTHWLIDVIAPSQKIATAVLANFKQVVKDKPTRIHPLVSQLVDPAVLERMRVST